MADSFPSGHTTASGRKLKLCCVCSDDLVGKERFKDHDGHYWCPTCAKEDTLRKEPAACAECNAQLTRGDLVDFEGKQLCKVCAERLRLAAKRAAARIAAAEEEGRLQQERRRKLLIYGGMAVAVLVVYVVVRMMI
ncbi:MAG: hypothetical protein NTU53_05655 [Planctomycetota bacterium]|nr:hypothetical protein [Planctomycetota bacterium]